MNNICLVAEHTQGKLKKTTLNALSCCRELARIWGGELHILVPGLDIGAVAGELSAFGPDRIWLIEHPALEHYTAEAWSLAVAQAAFERVAAGIVAMASGTTGKDLMPRVAARLGAGMASDVVGLGGEGGKDFIRPLWAGSALATVEVVTEIKVLTIQPTAFEAAEPAAKTCPVEPLTMNVDPAGARFVELQATRSDRPDLTEAGVIVSGGRGLDGPENFHLLEELADLFQGAVGATRAAVDAGWAPNDLQVGQTGKVVAPEVYFAVGLSGSTQHLAGMKNSRVIVAVNTDEEAPIFEVADYGLKADLFEAVPELITALKGEPAAS